MFDARGANEHRVTMLALQHAMMRDPTEGDLSKRETVFGGDSLDLSQGGEIGLVPIAYTVSLCSDHKVRNGDWGYNGERTLPCMLSVSKREPASTASSMER